MNDDTAKALIEALNRFSAVLEKLQGGSAALGGGVHIYHHAIPPTTPMYPPGFYPNQPSPLWPPTTCGSTRAVQ